MTGQTSNESTPKGVAPLAPKLSGNPPTPGKVIPMASPGLPQRPPFLYNPIELTAELRLDIDKLWDACWPINMLRPLVLLDLISYLLFIKKLEERELIAGKQTDTSMDNLIHTKETDKHSWSRFKAMDAQSMHQVFSEENGIADKIKNYGHTNLPYSLFVKEPLLLAPTAKLLANMVHIIKIMDAEDSDIRAAIFEYLLNKAEIVGQNGQVYAPDYVVKLMVALMQPAPEDLIGDPSTGNGSFLVNCATYIANKKSASTPDVKNDFVADIYRGIECDLIQLRIGAMNMMLHGIEDPKLEGINVFSTANLSLRKQPTLILSNLFFEAVEDKMTDKTNTLHPEARKKEIRFLNLILKSLKTGGRAALIIREIILYDNITEIKTIRQQIIDDHNLEAVISLPGKAGSFFSCACILIFTKPESGTTDKVWFYKMAGKEEINGDVPDILNRWKNDEETGRRRTDKSFYVPVDEIKANNYNLSFNDYRKTGKDPEIHTPNKSFIQDKENVPRDIIREQGEPNVEGIELPAEEAPAKRRRLTPVFASLMVICIAAVAFYFMYFRNNDNAISDTKKNVALTEIKPLQPTKPVTKTPVTKNTPEPAMLSREQIRAILKDTTGILHFQDQPGKTPASIKDPAKKLAKPSNANTLTDKTPPKTPEPVASANTLTDKTPGKTPEPVASENILKVQYTVADTTFFHDQPDISTRRKSYLDPLNKNVLNPIDDRNGFIYIVYTNHFGRTSKGWINKKDLRPLR